jgi:hypothetical protein
VLLFNNKNAFYVFVFVYSTFCVSSKSLLDDPSLNALTYNIPIITTPAHTPPHHVPYIAYDQITGDEYIEIDEACYAKPTMLLYYLAILAYDISLVRTIPSPTLEQLCAIQIESYLFALHWLSTQEYDFQQQCKRELVAMHCLPDYYVIGEYERNMHGLTHDDAMLRVIQDHLIERYHGNKAIQDAMQLLAQKT